MIKKIWLGIGGLSLITALAMIVWVFADAFGWWAPVLAAGCLAFGASASNFVAWALPALIEKLEKRHNLKQAVEEDKE
jgi:uncharacterized membrane protein YqjE